jgi:hypothetical protein
MGRPYHFTVEKGTPMGSIGSMSEHGLAHLFHERAEASPKTQASEDGAGRNVAVLAWLACGVFGIAVWAVAAYYVVSLF